MGSLAGFIGFEMGGAAPETPDAVFLRLGGGT